MKDSRWSLDLFRCESIALRTHWILVVMDQFTRRIIGFGVHVGNVDGISLCRMFNHAMGDDRPIRTQVAHSFLWISIPIDGNRNAMDFL
jgi:hypothetical protein